MKKKQEECGKETVSRQREAQKRQRRSSWLACTLHLEQDCQKVGSTKSQSHEVRKGRECNATLSLYSFFFTVQQHLRSSDRLFFHNAQFPLNISLKTAFKCL
jgi:hypothetical protein